MSARVSKVLSIVTVHSKYRGGSVGTAGGERGGGVGGDGGASGGGGGGSNSRDFLPSHPRYPLAAAFGGNVLLMCC